MLTIDAGTLALVLIPIAAISSWAMVAACYSHKIYAGPGYWAGASILITCSASLFYLQGLLPPIVTEVPARTLAVLAACCLSFGMYRFFSLRPKRRAYAAAIAVAVVLFLYFTVREDDPVKRMTVFSIIYGIIFFDVACITFSNSPKRLTGVFYVTSSVFLIIAIFYMVQGASIPFLSEITLQRFSQSISSVTLLVSICGIVGWTTGLIMMASARLEIDLQDQATHDPLTGIGNRRKFFDESKMALAMARRYKRPFSILLFDIDYFKKVNDTFGHKTGDDVLKAISVMCQRQARLGDIVARMGGEEFIMMLPETSYDQAILVAERLRKEISGITLKVDGAPVRVTCSFGVTEYNEGDDDIDEIVGRADKALYRAKEEGRNRVCGNRSKFTVSTSAGLLPL